MNSLGFVEVTTESDIRGVISDEMHAGLRLTVRLLNDIYLTSTLNLSRHAMVLDLNGYSIIGTAGVEPLIDIGNGISVTDVGAMLYSNSLLSQGPVQDVVVKNGYLYSNGGAVFTMQASRVSLRELTIDGGDKLFDGSATATRAWSRLSDCSWTPDGVAAQTWPSGFRVTQLTITEPHGTITLLVGASITDSLLDGNVVCSGDSSMVQGCNANGGVLDFTTSALNHRNISNNVRTGATSGATIGANDIFGDNN